jgi:uncharacterized lipoprotein YddW (UPF0748 family)
VSIQLWKDVLMHRNPTARCAVLGGLALCGLLVLPLSLSQGVAAKEPNSPQLPVGSTVPVPERIPASAPVPVPTPENTPISASALSPNTGLVGEVRAMWIVRDSMVSPQKVRNAVALAKKYGFNTIFVQVRGRGDAFYDSRYEPRSEELSRQPQDFDPLALAIEEGHKAGLEVHAWMNTFLVWSKSRRPYSARHIVNQHPEWLVQDKKGRRSCTPRHDCEGGFLDPAIPGVREHTKNVFLDVASRYDVDGIHFDYVRYPSCDYSFGPQTMAAFREYMLGQLTPNDRVFADTKLRKNRLAYFYLYPKEWDTWRKGLISETVREISEAVHQMRPPAIVSAAVFPNYRVASGDKGQAWRDWMRDGFLDAACPMTYNRSTEMVGAQVRDALANSSDRPVIPGVGAWQMSADSAIAKGRVMRQLGAGGINFFSYDGMTREGRTEAYLAKVAKALFTTPTTRPNWRRPYETARNPVEITRPDGM